MKGRLSQRQQGILDFIRNFMNDHQFPPTVRDIQGGCSISSTSVVDYNLHILQREGHLRRLPEVSRGIELVGMERSSSKDIVEVPVISSIAAGEPLHVPDVSSREADEIEQVPASLLKGRTDVFGLKVKGDSMIDAFIADGDLVLIEPRNHAETGEMVAAEIRDSESFTLKRFFLEGNTVRLQPENANMRPIIVDAKNVLVRGRVVGVIRSFR